MKSKLIKLIGIALVAITLTFIYLSRSGEENIAFGSAEFSQIKEDLIVPVCELNGEIYENDTAKDLFFSSYLAESSTLKNDYSNAFQPIFEGDFIDCELIETASKQEADDMDEKLIVPNEDDKISPEVMYIYTITIIVEEDGDTIKIIPSFHIGKEDGKLKVLEITVRKTSYV